eukprot:1115156-Prymnesium_polylepis.2
MPGLGGRGSRVTASRHVCWPHTNGHRRVAFACAASTPPDMTRPRCGCALWRGASAWGGD